MNRLILRETANDPNSLKKRGAARRCGWTVSCNATLHKETPMRTKRFVGRMVMIAVLAVGAAGVMPAPTCGGAGCTIPSTYAEQSSTGNPFELMWNWLEGFMASIL